MSYEDEFDKIIRDKVGEAEYPFDDTNWAKTSRLIDADRSLARKAALKKFFLPAAFVVGSTVLFFVSQFDTSKDLLAEKQQTTLSANNNSPQGEPSTFKTNSNNASAAEGQTSPAAKSEKSEMIASPDSKTEPANVVLSEKQPSVETAKGETNATPAEQTNSDPSMVASASGQKKANEHVTKTSASATNDVANNAFNAEKSGLEKNGRNKNGDIKVAPLMSLTAANEKAVASENKAAATDQDENSVTVNSDNEMLESDVLNANQMLLPQVAYNNDVKLPLTFLPRYEPDYYSKKAKTHFLNVEFGATYLLGWNTATGKDGQGLNMFGGLNYGYYLGKFSIGVGAQLYNITNIHKAFYEVERTEYGFGSTKSYTTVTTNDMYYVGVPIRVSYHLNRSNHIGLCFNAGYLVKMNNTVEGYAVVEGVKKENAGISNKALYDGVSSWNYMGSVFYNARLNDRFALHGEFVYSFADLFSNNNAVSNQENPMGLRVGLQYYIFDK